MAFYTALIKWYPLKVGRNNYLKLGAKYAPLIKILKNNSYWSIVFYITEMNSNNEAYIDFEFLSPFCNHNLIEIGDAFYICEGSKIVAEGEVISVNLSI